jgi:nitroreductase
VELREVLTTTPATREFTDEDIPDAVLWDLLDQARFAPNGGNRQAWHVIVVRDPATRGRLSELYDLGMREYAAQLRAGLVPFAAVDDGRPPAVDLAEARATPLDQPHDHIAKAPVLLVLLLDTRHASSVDSGLGRVPLTAGGSAFPFAHNVLLAARDAGYGGHLTSVLSRQEPAVRELLGFPGHYALATMVPLGRPARVVTRLRRAAVDEFVTLESFDGPAFAQPDGG